MNRGFDSQREREAHAAVQGGEAGTFSDGWPEPELDGLALDDTKAAMDEFDEPSLSGVALASLETGFSGAFVIPDAMPGREVGRASSGLLASEPSDTFPIPDLLMGEALDWGSPGPSASGAFALPPVPSGSGSGRTVINLALEGGPGSELPGRAPSSPAEDSEPSQLSQSGELAVIGDLLGEDALSALRSLSQHRVEGKERAEAPHVASSPERAESPHHQGAERGVPARPKSASWPEVEGLELPRLPPLPPLSAFAAGEPPTELSFATSTFSVLHVAEPQAPALPPLPPLPPPTAEAMTEFSFATSTFEVLHFSDSPGPVAEPARPTEMPALEAQPPALSALDEPMSFELEAPVESDMADGQPGSGGQRASAGFEAFAPRPEDGATGQEEEQLSLEPDRGLTMLAGKYGESMSGWQDPVLPPVDKPVVAPPPVAHPQLGSFEGGTPLDMGPLIDLGPLDLPPFAPSSGPVRAVNIPAAGPALPPVALSPGLAAPAMAAPMVGPSPAMATPAMAAPAMAPVPLPPAPMAGVPLPPAPGAAIPVPAPPGQHPAPAAMAGPPPMPAMPAGLGLELSDLASMPLMPGLDVPDSGALIGGSPVGAVGASLAPGESWMQDTPFASSRSGGLQLSEETGLEPPVAPGLEAGGGKPGQAASRLTAGPVTPDERNVAAPGAPGARSQTSGQSGMLRAMPLPGTQGMLDPPFMPMGSTGGRTTPLSLQGAAARESGQMSVPALSLEGDESHEHAAMNRTGLRLMAQGLVQQKKQAAARRDHPVALHEPLSEAVAVAPPEKIVPRKHWSLAGGLSLALVAVMGGAIALKPELADQLLGGVNDAVGGVVSTASVGQPQSPGPRRSQASLEPVVKEKTVSGADAPVNQAMHEALKKGGNAPVDPQTEVARNVTTAPAGEKPGSEGSSTPVKALVTTPAAKDPAPTGPGAAGAVKDGVAEKGDTPADDLIGLPPQGEVSADAASVVARRQLHEYLDNGRDSIKNYDYALATQQLEAAREVARDLQDIATLNWLRTALGRIYMQRGELIMRETLVTLEDCQMARDYFRKAQSLGMNGTHNEFNIKSSERCTNRRPGEKGR